MAIDTTDNQHRVASTKKGPVRKQRIERWVHKDRREHLSEASDGMACPMKRRLNAHVYQLGEQRQRLIEQSNFDQKLFANKQAVRHKDNQPILR